MDDPMLAFFHLASLVVSAAVALLLYPIVRRGLALKSGLVFEMGRGLLMPPMFIAVFCAINTSMEFEIIPEPYHLVAHVLSDIILIAVSLSLLSLALRIRLHVKRMEA